MVIPGTERRGESMVSKSQRKRLATIKRKKKLKAAWLAVDELEQQPVIKPVERIELGKVVTISFKNQTPFEHGIMGTLRQLHPHIIVEVDYGDDEPEGEMLIPWHGITAMWVRDG